MSLFTRRRATIFALATTLLAASTSSTTALAQSDADKATARSLGQEGQAALDKKDFKGAEDRFRRADSLFHAPTLALGLARSQAALGRFVAAQETYNRIIREGTAPGAPAVFVKAIEDAKSEVGGVSAKVAGVTITVAGPENPKVLLDDASVPAAALGVNRPVDPGAHVVKATADGFEPAETKFSVAEGGSAIAALTMRKSAVAAGPVPAVVPATAPGAAPVAGTTTPSDTAMTGSADTGVSSKSSQKTIGFVALGVGGAALAVGAVTGLLALGKHSTLQDACPNGVCPAGQQSDLDSYHTMGTISTIGFIAGGAGVIAGTVLILTAPKSAPAATASRGPHVTPFVGLGSVGAFGTF